MAVRQEKNKTWTADFRYLDLIENKQKRYKKRGFNTKREANEFEVNFKLTQTTNSTKLTLRMLFLERQSSGDANKYTIKSNKIFAEKYLKALLDQRYNNITKSDIQKWRAIINNYDLATSSKNRLIYIIRSACRYANMTYDLEDKSKNLKKIKPRFDEQPKIEVWTIEEFNKFYACIDSYIYAAFFRLLFFSGMRKGEAKALYKTDLNNSYITINKSMRREVETLSSTKNNASVRIIRIDSVTNEMLKTLQKREGQFMFGDYEPLTNSTLQRVFANTTKKAGIKKIRIHDLRHSHATILINSGANIVAVSKRLGHTDTNVTLNVYTHLLVKTEEDMMNKIENGAKMVPNQFYDI